MNALNPYLKAIVPVVLTVIGVLGTTYGNLPWWAPVAAGITAVLTYLVPNTAKPPAANVEARGENVPPKPLV